MKTNLFLRLSIRNVAVSSWDFINKHPSTAVLIIIAMLLAACGTFEKQSNEQVDISKFPPSDAVLEPTLPISTEIPDLCQNIIVPSTSDLLWEKPLEDNLLVLDEPTISMPGLLKESIAQLYADLTLLGIQAAEISFVGDDSDLSRPWAVVARTTSGGVVQGYFSDGMKEQLSYPLAFVCDSGDEVVRLSTEIDGRPVEYRIIESIDGQIEFVFDGEERPQWVTGIAPTFSDLMSYEKYWDVSSQSWVLSIDLEAAVDIVQDDKQTFVGVGEDGSALFKWTGGEWEPVEKEYKPSEIAELMDIEINQQRRYSVKKTTTAERNGYFLIDEYTGEKLVWLGEDNLDHPNQWSNTTPEEKFGHMVEIESRVSFDKNFRVGDPFHPYDGGIQSLRIRMKYTGNAVLVPVQMDVEGKTISRDQGCIQVVFRDAAGNLVIANILLESTDLNGTWLLDTPDNLGNGPRMHQVDVQSIQRIMKPGQTLDISLYHVINGDKLVSSDCIITPGSSLAWCGDEYNNGLQLFTIFRNHHQVIIDAIKNGTEVPVELRDSRNTVLVPAWVIEAVGLRPKNTIQK